nr:SH3 domain-containing protein [Bacilli bacterium]
MRNTRRYACFLHIHHHLPLHAQAIIGSTILRFLDLGEIVRLLRSSHRAWCYVITKEGKMGYIYRCRYFFSPIHRYCNLCK